MPVAKPNKIPGTDPEFHEMRLYMTPMTYKGKKILAFHASCKHPKCGFSSAWASDAGREVGIFKHRSEKVTEARRDHFVRKLGGDLVRINLSLRDVSDKNSHTYENWTENIEAIYRSYIGDPFEIDRENKQLKVDYYIGLTAQEVARKIFSQNFDRC